MNMKIELKKYAIGIAAWQKGNSRMWKLQEAEQKNTSHLQQYEHITL